MASKKRKLSLLDILISLPADPAGMMKQLLRETTPPPHLLLAPLATFAVLVAPTIYRQTQLGLNPTESGILYGVLLTLAITFIAFNLLTVVMLRVLLIKAQPMQVLAGSLYALTGYIPFMLAFYVGNYVTSGKLTILDLFTTGFYRGDDWFLGMFPKVITVASVYVFFIFTNAIRAITYLRLFSSIALSLLTIPILIGSSVMGVTISNALLEGSGSQALQFFTGLLWPTKM